MARINTKRLNDVLDYERDIKGKRLIRISAGVASGKNYWIKETAKKYPDLRILFITSRKNVVIAQAKKMKASTFLDFDKVNDTDELQKNKHVVCTNAGISNYFKTKYDSTNPDTFIWERFDLIVLDEAHALTTDATFAECFHTERFLKYAYYKNKNCDIIFMSGTIVPLDWMLDSDSTPHIHDLNKFDDCVHLEPSVVYVMNKEFVKKNLVEKIKKGERCVYFANRKDSIADLTKYLIKKEISPDAIGYSFNYKEKDSELFPDEVADILEDKISEMNEALTTDEMVPEHIKVLFSTSKNKEGINILNDDIKTTYAESHNKAELIQMAGRVRGNEESGTGIDTLVIVSDATQHNNYPNEFNYIFNKKILEGLDMTLEECKLKENEFLKVSTPEELLRKKSKCDCFRYIRYDYIGECFFAYKGKIEGERQHERDIKEFEQIMNNEVERNGNKVKGEEILATEWFKWSKIYVLHKTLKDIRQDASIKLRTFLNQKGYLVNKINKYDRDVVIRTEIERLISIYGYKNLGFANETFDRVGRALKKFDIQILECVKSEGYETFELIDLWKLGD